LAEKRPEGKWFKPTPYLRVTDHVLDDGMASVVGLEVEGRAFPVR